MSSRDNKISNLEKLIKEKQQLKTFCTFQEKMIGYKFDELKKNFPEIIGNELLSFSLQKNTKIFSILDIANMFILRFLPARYRNNRLTEMALKLIEVIVIRVLSKKMKAKSDG
jgi:hypothetical protein